MCTGRVCTIGFLASVAFFLLGGCPPLESTGTGDEATKLERFQSAEELVSYFQTQARQRHTEAVRARDYGWGPWGGVLAINDAATGAEDSGSGDQTADTEFSTTNLQEAGVDEGDLFKSDGQYFYVASDNWLYIVQATPTSALAQVGKLELDHPIAALYLYESKVIALASVYTELSDSDGIATEIWPPYRWESSLAAYEIDVSTPTTPSVTAEMEVDGTLIDSRLTNGRLILVMTYLPPLELPLSTPTIDALTVDELLPDMTTGAGGAPLVVATDWYHPDVADGFETTVVATLDASDVTSKLGAVAIMARAGTIYSTTETLYISDTDYDATNNYREKTVLHKFAYDADGVAQYVGTGAVPGRLLNQFSLGENDAYLRVATHVSNWQRFWFGDIAVSMANAASEAAAEDVVAPTGPYNAVYVLHESAGGLEVVGQVENIAPGEDLYAARFMGTRGFLVTYLQTDPLFVVDLSDPTAPTVAGELEVPGFSEYLHPYGDDLLIGVGRSGTDGTVVGAQLSLFNVSDLSNPTLIDQIALGGYGSYSEVSNTHKAFTFMPNSGRLAIPVVLWAETTGGVDDQLYSYGPFDGVICYQVSAAGFTELGRLANPTTEEFTSPYMWWGYYYSLRRAAFIGDDIYAITPAGVRGAPLSDFTASTTALFSE